MNYELTKQLKKAGFPQEPTIELPNSFEENQIRGGFYSTFPTEGGCGGVVWLNYIEYLEYLKKKGWTTIKYPTLSELIYECMKPIGESDNRQGFRLEAEMFDRDGQLSLEWRASREIRMGDFGLRPEEAVANLYLSFTNPSPAKGEN